MVEQAVVPACRIAEVITCTLSYNRTLVIQATHKQRTIDSSRPYAYKSTLVLDVDILFSSACADKA